VAQKHLLLIACRVKNFLIRILVNSSKEKEGKGKSAFFASNLGLLTLVMIEGGFKFKQFNLVLVENKLWR
jgi:hypothetical protein